MVKTAKLIEPTFDIFDNVMKSGFNVPKQIKANPAREDLAQWIGKSHCGDCIDLMNKMSKQSVSVIVTSPPYNLRNSTGNGMKNGNGGKWQNAALMNGYTDHDDNMPYEKYVKWQRNCLTAMMQVLTHDGVIFYNHKWRVQNGLLRIDMILLKNFRCGK